MKHPLMTAFNPRALEQAREADAAQRRGDPLGPLHGVPIVVKDTYSTAGILTTAGYPGLKDYVPTEDSVVVGLLRKVGAIDGLHSLAVLGPVARSDSFGGIPVSAEIKDRIRAFAARLQAAGAHVEQTEPTAFAHQKPTSHFGDFGVYGKPLQVNGQQVPYYVATQSYTTLFAVTENPVVTLPLGLDSQGLPIGVQVAELLDTLRADP